MSVWQRLVGQQHVVEVLRDAIVTPEAMTHAWLFTGPPGSGRSVAATAFAAALQCEAAEPGCGHCEQCRLTLAGSHPDVTRVTTEKVIIAIDEVRELITTAQRSPALGQWRIIIIEDADRMLERTANILLKSIEEPPPRTVWLLCAPARDDLITTIRSRCRHIGLRIPPVSDVADLLVRRDGIDPEVALAAARAAQSHVGVAKRLATDEQAQARRKHLLRIPVQIRSVFDAVLIAEELVDIAEQDAVAAGGERDAKEMETLLRNLGITDGTARQPPAVSAQVRALKEEQKRRATRLQRDVLDRMMVDLLALYRDVVSVQLGADVDLINTDLASDIAELAAKTTIATSIEAMDALAVARRRLAGNVRPLLALEGLLVALRPQGGN
ncbi:MAG: DNA polymerase III subunit delta' [Bowdeniella nasicola]|nr:DNA polymerase III subunit delta' [Bowdeniella nasicola]